MRSELRNWGEILRTQNLSPGRVMDPVSRWLLISRASLFPLTVTSGAIGGLLALGNPNARWGCFAIAFLALILARSRLRSICGQHVVPCHCVAFLARALARRQSEFSADQVGGRLSLAGAFEAFTDSQLFS